MKILLDVYLKGCDMSAGGGADGLSRGFVGG